MVKKFRLVSKPIENNSSAVRIHEQISSLNLVNANLKDEMPESEQIVLDLIEAIKFNLTKEYETINEYNQILRRYDNKQINRIIKNIIKDEQTHIGELYKALSIIAPNEVVRLNEGVKEAEEYLAKESAETEEEK